MSNQRASEDLSQFYRTRTIDLNGKRVLITGFAGTLQEHDLSEPPNCGGFGRIRHFQRTQSRRWSGNPLPIDPAIDSLGLPAANSLRTQLFQTAACNWRCWYCFVPFSLLSADPAHGAWLTADDLVDRYVTLIDRPQVVVLSGGQPDLTPEWTIWMLQALRNRKLANDTYVWADDNLSNDYVWRYLTTEDKRIIQSYPHFGKVGCFKGFDSVSFAYNTKAGESLYEQQFELFERQLSLGIDLYAYVTITTPTAQGLDRKMESFIDRLQSIHPLLPLRTIPLEVQMFGTVRARGKHPNQEAALENQYRAHEAWQAILERRFSSAARCQPITRINLRA